MINPPSLFVCSIHAARMNAYRKLRKLSENSRNLLALLEMRRKLSNRYKSLTTIVESTSNELEKVEKMHELMQNSPFITQLKDIIVYLRNDDIHNFKILCEEEVVDRYFSARITITLIYQPDQRIYKMSFDEDMQGKYTTLDIGTPRLSATIWLYLCCIYKIRVIDEEIKPYLSGYMVDAKTVDRLNDDRKELNAKKNKISDEIALYETAMDPRGYVECVKKLKETLACTYSELSSTQPKLRAMENTINRHKVDGLSNIMRMILCIYTIMTAIGRCTKDLPLDIPTDPRLCDRSLIQNVTNRFVELQLDKHFADHIKEYCKEHECSVFEGCSCINHCLSQTRPGSIYSHNDDVQFKHLLTMTFRHLMPSTAETVWRDGRYRNDTKQKPLCEACNTRLREIEDSIVVGYEAREFFANSPLNPQTPLILEYLGVKQPPKYEEKQNE